MSKKQNLGQFNTRNDVWLRPHIRDFIGDSGCKYVLDPFAGQGDLLHATKEFDFVDYFGLDIDTDLCTVQGWTWNNSLEYIPRTEDTIVITNPPYLAKNSAARNDLESYRWFDGANERYEDLYQIALQKVLEQYEKAVFIIPETYFQTAFFKQHMHSYTVIEENPFEDTDCPICVAAFNVSNDFYRIAGNNYDIYKNDDYLFTKHILDDILWDFKSHRHGNIAWTLPPRGMTFNDIDGNLGLRGVDGVDPSDRIRFCKPEELAYNLCKIGETSRAITVINVKDMQVTDEFIFRANFLLGELRKRTHDVVLSPFKNNNKIGCRRRRLDFKWARKIIEKTIEALDK